MRERNDGICRRNHLLATAGAAILLTVTGAESVWSQALTQLNNQTSLQNRVGGAVSTVCGGLAGAGTNRNGASATEDLFGRCQDLVQTGNSVVGTGATTFDLGLNNDQTNDALLQISHDESPAAGNNASETQISAVQGRISTLRSGSGRGVDFSGLLVPVGDRMISLATLRPGLSLDDAAPGNAAGQDDEETFGSGLGIFVSGALSVGERDGSNEELGYDFDTAGITVGADYPLSDSVVVGATVGYERTENDFDRNGGELEQDSYSVNAYGTYFVGDSLYLEGVVGYAFNEYDQDRRIVYSNVNRTANGDTDGDEISLHVGGGYDWYREAWTYGLYSSLTYTRTEIDRFTETGANGLNLRYDSQTIRSLAGVFGAQASYAISTDFGIISPGARIEYEHEFDDDSRSLTVQYDADPSNTRFFVRTDSPDRNVFNVALSVAALFAGGTTLFADVQTLLGHEDVDQTTFTLGGRISF